MMATPTIGGNLHPVCIAVGKVLWGIHKTTMQAGYRAVNGRRYLCQGDVGNGRPYGLIPSPACLDAAALSCPVNLSPVVKDQPAHAQRTFGKHISKWVGMASGNIITPTGAASPGGSMNAAVTN